MKIRYSYALSPPVAARELGDRLPAEERWRPAQLEHQTDHSFFSNCPVAFLSLSEDQLEMAVPSVVTIQPQYGMAVPAASRNMWQTGLMDCCTDCSVCECLRWSCLSAVGSDVLWSVPCPLGTLFLPLPLGLVVPWLQPCSLVVPILTLMPAVPGRQAEPHPPLRFSPCQAAAGCSASPASPAKWPGT